MVLLTFKQFDLFYLKYKQVTKILDSHHLWSRIPPCSDCFQVYNVCSAFFRQYLRNLGWFLFLKVLRCFSSLRKINFCGLPQWRFTCLWGFSSSDFSQLYTSICVVEPKHPLKTLVMRGGIEPPTIEVWFRRSTKLNYLIHSQQDVCRENFFLSSKEESASFTAWTTRVSNPVCSPRFRASASKSDQVAAFATGVLPNIYEFHLYTGNSTTLFRFLALQS